MKYAIILLAVGVTALPATAFAAELSNDQSRIVMQNFAACMAETRERDARAFVDFGPATPPDNQLKLLHAGCLPGKPSAFMPTFLSMQSRMTHYRYALAEALLLRANRRSTPAIVFTAPRLAHPVIEAGSAAPVTWTGGPSAWAAAVSQSQHDARLSAFGECVVRASPDQSWALLKSDVASKAEKLALTTLTPTLARCLAQDRSVQLGKFSVRGTIALNLYRLSKAPRNAPGSTR